MTSPGTRHGSRRGPRFAAGAAALLLATGPAGTCLAAEPARTWFGAGLLAGSTLLDSHFSDFQWDVRPRLAWGAEALAGRGPWTTGVRVWRATSTQEIGQPGSESPDVAVSSFELVGQRRLASLAGAELVGSGSVGGVLLGYHPDQVTITPPGSTPIVVDLAPVKEWTVGAGLALRRTVAGHWSASVSVDYQTFGLDAAHRNGNSIEMRRESFGDWSARLGLAWLSWRL